MRKHSNTLGLQWPVSLPVFAIAATGFAFFFSPETSAPIPSGSTDLGGMLIAQNCVVSIRLQAVRNFQVQLLVGSLNILNIYNHFIVQENVNGPLSGFTTTQVIISEYKLNVFTSRET